ncbi:hypothetical protein [Streptomyces sp. NPDC003456]
MHPTAELIGAAATLFVLGILTVASVRSISRRKDASREARGGGMP